MTFSRIASVLTITLLAASVAFSQDPRQEQAPTPAPAQTPGTASSGSDPDSSGPQPKRVHVGFAVTRATLIYQVTPTYPRGAKKHHIEGTILLHAIIAKDGKIRSLAYVSGPPELMDSAMKAVKKWRYKPTLLNGDPVEVDTTITVVFTLGGS